MPLLLEHHDSLALERLLPGPGRYVERRLCYLQPRIAPTPFVLWPASLVVAESQPCEALVPVRLRVAGFQFDRSLVTAHGRSMAIQCLQGVTTVVERLDVIRFQDKGALVVLERLLVSFEILQRGGDVECLNAVGLYLECFLVTRQCVLVSPQPGERRTAITERLGIQGTQCQGAIAID